MQRNSNNQNNTYTGSNSATSLPTSSNKKLFIKMKQSQRTRNQQANVYSINETISQQRQTELNTLPIKGLLTHEEIHKKEIPSSLSTLLSQITIGAARDFIWTVAARRNLDAFDGLFGLLGGSTVTQMGCTVLPMLGAIKLTVGTYQGFFIDNRRNWLKAQSIFAIASWTAIPFWNAAQYLGNWVGQSAGLNDVNAGYFSGIFSGIAETLWQNALIIPILTQQPGDVIEVALNTLGGAVWQWIYQANLPLHHEATEPDWTDAFVGLQIASGVAASTLIMTMIAWQIKRCQNCRQTIEQSPLTEDGSLLPPGSAPLEYKAFPAEIVTAIDNISNEEEILNDAMDDHDIEKSIQGRRQNALFQLPDEETDLINVIVGNKNKIN